MSPTDHHAVDRLVDQAVRLLREEGAREVYLFGSVATGGTHPGSDLDLAVSGLPADRYFRAVGRLLLELPVLVDLVDLDTPSPFTARLRASGALRRVA